MKRFALALAAAVLVPACANKAALETLTWSVNCPATVEEFGKLDFVVNASDASGPQNDVRYYYRIEYPGGSWSPLANLGKTGTTESVKARLAKGPCTLIITARNHNKLDVKVAEAKFEVK
jgi:hypothetical protein